jgi:hypothetical protein
MKKYFYTDGINNFGPFTIDELRDEGISRDTLIWYQGLNEWSKAGTIHELNEIFANMPPPIYKPGGIPKDQKPPKTWLVESILVTLFCCLPFGIAGIVNASKVESQFYSGDIDGAERSSEEAKKWTSISLGLGIVGVVLYFILILATAAMDAR